MKPHEVIKENLDKVINELEENFKEYFTDGYPFENYIAIKNSTKLELVISILLSVKEMVGDNMFEDSAQAGQFSMHADGYNNALEDLQALLDEEINKIKELN